LVVNGSFLPFAISDSSRSTRKMMSIGLPSLRPARSIGSNRVDYGTRAGAQRPLIA
jgi:hypothetical protein